MSAQPLSRAPLRMRAAFILLMAVGIVLAARLFYWQIIRWDDLSRRADRQNTFEITVPAPRGDILTRDGTLLAKDVFLYTINISPKDVSAPDQLATDLAPILKLPRDAILAKLKSDQSTVVLMRDAPPEIGEAVLEFKNRRRLLYLSVDAKPVRLYPNGSFAHADCRDCQRRAQSRVWSRAVQRWRVARYGWQGGGIEQRAQRTDSV
jgi:stage V sporulation protein D (sporulation-specific penicillin-binding protein)